MADEPSDPKTPGTPAPPAGEPAAKPAAPPTKPAAAPAPAGAAGAGAAKAPAPAAGSPAAKPPAKPAAPKEPPGKDAMGDPLVERLQAAVPGAVKAARELVGQLAVELAPDKVVDACRYLKEQETFTYLVDLTAVDWKTEPRFEIVYWLHSFAKADQRVRLRAKVAAVDGTYALASVSSVWKVAAWPEREVWDMYGVVFTGNPDLRRILTWEGFEGHPLRKDFPIEGVDTGAAIYPDDYPEGGGPPAKDTNKKVVS